MSDSHFINIHSRGPPITKIILTLALLLGPLPTLISTGFSGFKFPPLISIKSRKYDLSSSSSQPSDYIDEASSIKDLTSPSLTNSFTTSPGSPTLTNPFQVNSASYGLPNTKGYTTSSSSVNVLPGGSIVQSSADNAFPQQSSFTPYMGNFQNPSIYPNRFANLHYPQPSRRANSFDFPYRPYGPSHRQPLFPGQSPSFGRYPSPFTSRFPGYPPYYRSGLRRNGYKSRFGKGRYKRYRQPYSSSRNYRSWYPRYRSSKYTPDYDYEPDARETDSMMPLASAPSETFYSITANNNHNPGPKEYLKIGGIGNNILNYLASSLLKGPEMNNKMKINSTLNNSSNSSLDASAETLYDGPFIQFGETKITLKSNDKGGITVTVGRTKM